MRIRTFIFLTIIALGLLPLFILVSLNLPRTVSRFESAALLESQAVSKAGYTRLNARIRCINKSLLRAATLPFTNMVVTDGSQKEALTQTIVQWFGNDQQVTGVKLHTATGRLVLSFFRRDGTDQLEQVFSASNSDLHPLPSLDVFESGVVYPELVENRPEPGLTNEEAVYSLRLSTPVTDSSGRNTGIMSLLINLGVFLDDYLDAVWVNTSGKPFYGCTQPVHQPKFIASSLKRSGDCVVVDFEAMFDQGKGMTPYLSEDYFSHTKTSWMPLVFGDEETPVMWVGSPVDESSIHQWKRSLLVNVVTIVCLMTIIVFIAATRITRRLDKIRKELIEGLDDIMHKGREVSFHWHGPREVQHLAQDLNSLSKHFVAVSEQRNRAISIYRESEEKFRRLAESAHDAIILITAHGNIAYWNRAAEVLLETTPGQMGKDRLSDVLDISTHSEKLSLEDFIVNSSLYTSGKPFECFVITKNNKRVAVELALSSATIQGTWHGIWVVRDISERKKNEELAIKQQQQLLHADKMISLGLLVSGVAHEINNPNSIALLNVPILVRSWESVLPVLDRYYREYGDFSVAGIEFSEMRVQLPEICSELEESSVRIRQIVKDLKDYARQEATEEFLPVDVNDVVRAAVRLTMSGIRKATTRFNVDYSADLPQVKGIRQRLIQVVINLIQNSCEAISSSDQALGVQTRYCKSSGMVEIIVEDQGSGIDSEIIDKVCDPFFTTKRNAGGTGLGLSVSSGIVKQHGGMLSFSSEPGKVTKVNIQLPC